MNSQAFFPEHHLKNERKDLVLEGMQYPHFGVA